ncbi:MAG: gliding motility-associated C-terminal domain-containing protein [Cyclobacteriaceae bacterium]|nr:gliding motility-associated C-terminal domain-containing protein [Cyclobacteriaceae bacterium]
MKNFLILIIIIIHGLCANAQQFQQVQSIDLPAGYTGKSLHWLDMNHDGELDVLVQATDQLDYYVFLIYKNEDAEFSFVHTVETGIKNAACTYTDINMDGQVDIILSGASDNGPLTTALISDGNFNFSLLDSPLLSIAGSVIKFADLNQNGIKELIISGTSTDGSFFSIFELQQNTWTLVKDSIKVHASFIDAHDFNQDGVNDLFISGQLENTSSYHAILINDRFLNFTEGILIKGIAEVSPWLADINYDGIFDVVLAGINTNHEGVVLTVASTETGDSTIEETTSLDFKPKQLFAADLDSDGQVDIQVQGEDQTATHFNKIFLANEAIEPLPSNDLIAQRFGDFDYDGDLDLVQLTGNITQAISIYRNTNTNINAPPTAPSSPIAVILFERLFMYWDRSTDNLTHQPSITYDVTVQTQNKEIVSGNFDLLNKRRLQIEHGNNGTKNFAFFKDFKNSEFAYHIQSIDNAFHSGEYSCSGFGGGGACLNVHEEAVTLCKSESKILEANANALWFSFNKGFLGEGTTYKYESNVTDTVFYLIPAKNATACAHLNLFLPERKDTLVREYYDTRFACENSQLEFEADGNWDQVEWSCYKNGFLSNEPAITYTVTTADTVKLFVSDGAGCSEIHRTTIEISKPVITLNGQSFQILRGEEVQLNAFGGIQYTWSPAAGLNNSTIPNPIASPAVTTAYTVTVADSIGCAASANVTVVVQQQAFIPNLFTPNQDGTNDQLRIYGLSQVKDFSFSIINREGNTMYSTTDVTEATQRGWDGSVKGVLQPGGVYYWKVNGQLLNGSKLLLNGKDSGSIVLIR